MIILRKKLLKKVLATEAVYEGGIKMKNKMNMETAMNTETAVCILRAFEKCWGVKLNLVEIKRMVLLPTTPEDNDSEIYAICSKHIEPKKDEQMYVAKISRNEDGEIQKILVAVHPPIREAARVWKEEQKK